jgi:hypothetical protein
VQWLVPWHSVADNSAQVARIQQELARELSAGHPLFGLPVHALARRQDCDDVLFAVDDGSGRVAVVHLTCTRSPPEKPPWPITLVYKSFETWMAERMRPDHEEFDAESFE